MILIIDGYNYLKTIYQDIDDQDRNRFIRIIQRYARVKKHSIVLVFDGGDCLYPYREVFNRVTVVYTGPRLTADDFICEQLALLHKDQAIIVSNDRKLIDYAQHRGFGSVKVHTFRFYILRALDDSSCDAAVSKSVAVKLTTDVHDELDCLMTCKDFEIPSKKDSISYDMISSTNNSCKKKGKAKLSCRKNLKL